MAKSSVRRLKRRDNLGISHRTDEWANDQRHRAAPMTPTIFQDRIAAPVHAMVLSFT
jgi:hypothetical protein